MSPNSAPATVLDFFAYLVADDDAAAARERFCEVVAAGISNVASWLGVDAWLAAGDVRDAKAAELAQADPVRQRAFIATGLVAQVGSELVSGTLLLFRNGNEYGAFALLRQLIECEYLLRAFQLNFADAARWLDANDEDRWDFKPSKLREVGGFDRKEYANHCRSGGHPHPAAGPLLQLPRALGRLQHAVAGGGGADLDTTRILWLDFALHCDRTWRALTELLSAEHARFDRVRSEAIAAVAESRAAWVELDVLAVHAGSVLEVLDADPTTPLSDVVDLTD